MTASMIDIFTAHEIRCFWTADQILMRKGKLGVFVASASTITLRAGEFSIDLIQSTRQRMLRDSIAIFCHLN